MTKPVFIVHIPKNGGTSLRQMLIAKHVDRLPAHGHHHTALEFQEQYGVEFDRRYKISFVRNPWDRLVSIYYYYKHNWKQENHKRLSDILPNSFEEYVMENCIDDSNNPLGPAFYGHKKNQKYWICNQNGNLMIDFVGRFENYNQDIKLLFNNLDIHGNVYIPHTRKSAKRDMNYRNHYNNKTKNIVGDYLIDDITYFNYDF